jgi:post-segregation antitoxin (ccd killing protein)
MKKVQRNITIDMDLDYELKERPYINVSGFCNKKLREHIEKEKQQNE